MRPLHNAEAEQAILGALLIEPECWDECGDLITPSDVFFSPAHRAIGETIASLIRSRQTCDPITVLAAMNARNLTPDPVPRELPFALSRGLGTTGNVRYYAEIVRELWVKREAKRAAKAILEDDSDEPADAFLARHVSALQRIETGKSGGARPLGEHMIAVLEELEEQRKNPRAPSSWISTGFKALDDCIGGFRSDALAVFSGRPGEGKSALAVALADNLASRGIGVAAFWLEDSARDFARRAWMRRAQISSVVMRHGSRFTKEHWDRIGAVSASISWPIYVDDTHGITANEIALRMRRVVREHPEVKVIFADHLGEIRIDRQDRWGDRHDLATGLAAKTFRDAAKDLGVCPVLMVQLNRAIEKRADPAPKLSDLKDSGDIEAVARVIGFVSCPTEMRNGRKVHTGKFLIDVPKNTSGPKNLTVELDFLEDYMSVVGEPPNSAIGAAIEPAHWTERREQ